jgi:outer membrane protein assembly factor BamB
MHWFRLGFYGLCATLITNVSTADDWPQWMGPQRDGVWRETGVVDKFPAGGLPVRWRVKIGGGYAGPAVVGNRVFVTDKQMPDGARNPDNPFQRGRMAATERVLCLNDADGSIVWKHEYDCPYTVSYPAGPRTTPVVRDGRVYTLGAEGHLFCLNAEDGQVVWSKNFRTDYSHSEAPVWGYSANPLLDGDRLICLVGGKGTTVVAFHKDTGKELWRAIDSSGEHGPGYGVPIIIEAGGKRQLIVWHPRAISSLDPETGRIYWEHPFEVQSGLTAPMPRFDGERLFVTAFYNGALMLKLDRDQPTASLDWRRHGQNERNTDALHSIIATPVLDGGHIYGVCSYGELRCLDIANGDRKWATFQATSGQSARWGNAFLTRHADRYFLFSEQGDLIIAKLSPQGYEELSRAHLLDPTGPAQRRDVVWTHPAYAHRNVYARNDKEIVSVRLAAE